MRDLHAIQSSLSKRYQIDLVQDIFLNKRHLVVFYYNHRDSNPLLNIISGNLNIIGFSNKDSIQMDTLLKYFDTTSDFGGIIGHQLYRTKIIKAIRNIQLDETISFPIMKQGKRYWIQMTLSVVKYTSDHQPYIISGTIANISDQKKEEEQVLNSIHKDSLTGLFNRRTLLEHLSETNPTKQSLYFMLIDLDDFKLLNDHYGHIFGDLALQKFGLLLRSLVTDSIIFYRYAGDEFFIQIVDQDMDFVIAFANKLLAIAPTISIHEAVSYKMSLSIGIYHPTSFSDSVTEVIHKCDHAMYEAKRLGKNRFAFFKESGDYITPSI